MPPKILRRCDICHRYHVSFVITDPDSGKKTYLCYDCWKNCQAESSEGKKPEEHSQ